MTEQVFFQESPKKDSGLSPNSTPSTFATPISFSRVIISVTTIRLFRQLVLASAYCLMDFQLFCFDCLLLVDCERGKTVKMTCVTKKYETIFCPPATAAAVCFCLAISFLVLSVDPWGILTFSVCSSSTFDVTFIGLLGVTLALFSLNL